MGYDGGAAEAAKGFQAEAGLNSGFRFASDTNGQDAGQLNSLFRLLPQSTELMSPPVAGQGRMPLGGLVAIEGQG